MYELTPLGDRVIIKLTDDGKTESGLHIANPQGSPIGRAQVMSVGPGKHVNGAFVPTTLKPGEIILYSRGAAIEIPYSGGLYLMEEVSAIALVTESDRPQLVTA